MDRRLARLAARLPELADRANQIAAAMRFP
jgi:hypothetical protein